MGQSGKTKNRIIAFWSGCDNGVWSRPSRSVKCNELEDVLSDVVSSDDNVRPGSTGSVAAARGSAASTEQTIKQTTVTQWICDDKFHSPQGWFRWLRNRYPVPRTDTIYRGWAGSGSRIFLRRNTKLSIVLVVTSAD